MNVFAPAHYRRVMTRPMFMANLYRLFPELEDLPHHDTLARMLDRINVGEIEQAHIEMIRHLIRSKKFQRYLIAGCYPVAIDGTQKFTRAQLWDRECLERKVKTKKKKDGTLEAEEKKQYYVYVLEANLAFQNGMVIPLLSEVLSYTAGDNDKNKQDCEQRAFRRLGTRLKKCFSHLSIMVLLDGLYPNGPVVELCRKYKWDFMIVLQDKSLPSVWDVMRGYHYLMRLGHALNVLARHSYVLAKYVRDLGVRGLIAFVRSTIAGPWLDADELRKIATAPCQLRLE